MSASEINIVYPSISEAESMASVAYNDSTVLNNAPDSDGEAAEVSEIRLEMATLPAPFIPYATPPSTAFSLGMDQEAVSFSADDPDSGSEEEIEPAVIPRSTDVGDAIPDNSGTASAPTDTSPMEYTSTLDTTVTVTSTYTDNAAAKSEPPGMSVWVGPVVVLAYVALIVTSCEIIGWGSRMGWTEATRPLIAPGGEDRVLSRVMAALCSAASVLTWAAAVAIWVSGRTIIERAARRPILPVFLEAVRNREKLSNAVVRPGWRGVMLAVGTTFGACAGAALLAAATVAPATRAQRAFLATAVACLDVWALLYTLAVGTVGFYGHKLLTFSLVFGVIATFLSLHFCVFVFGVMWYFAAPCAMFLVLFGLFVIFGGMAWQTRRERVEVRGVW